MEILDSIYREIEKYDNAFLEPETEEIQEYVKVLWACAEMLAETNVVKNNPDNWTVLDEITADSILGEKPGDKVFKYPLTSVGQTLFVLTHIKHHDIGAWIRERRERAGLSRYALAKKIDCHISSITNWENNKQVPGIDKYVAIYNATK